VKGQTQIKITEEDWQSIHGRKKAEDFLKRSCAEQTVPFSVCLEVFAGAIFNKNFFHVLFAKQFIVITSKTPSFCTKGFILFICLHCCFQHISACPWLYHGNNAFTTLEITAGFMFVIRVCIFAFLFVWVV
jgi:hypothetical protein